MRVLVLGGGGQIARAVLATAPRPSDIVLKTRAELDIGDAPGVARVLKEVRPSWVVNGAAYTAVDLAEDQPEQAIAANDTAVGILANTTAQAGCRLLHLSTDFVFDGKSNRAYLPNDQTNPLSVYGVSKLAGERRILQAGGAGIVVRTSWVYASEGRNFVLTMLKLMRERQEIRVVCDQIGAPTWANSAATAIWGLIAAQGTAQPDCLHGAHSKRRVSDPGAASRIQPARYRIDESDAQNPHASLAAQLKEYAG
jgi:dTDP-4-dehydrorhamnose reductase